MLQLLFIIISMYIFKKKKKATKLYFVNLMKILINLIYI